VPLPAAGQPGGDISAGRSLLERMQTKDKDERIDVSPRLNAFAWNRVMVVAARGLLLRSVEGHLVWLVSGNLC
jgi:hypothetical protein